MSKLSLISSIFIISLFLLLGYFFVLMKSIMLPFVISMIFSYLLYPVVLRINRIGLGKNLSILIVSILFFSSFLLIIFLVLPILYRQLMNFITVIPSLIDTIINFIPDDIYNGIFDPSNMNKLNNGKVYDALLSGVQKFFVGIVHSGRFFINIGIFICIVPIITYYMLKDWNNLISKIYQMIPRKYYKSFVKQAKEVDSIIFRYLIGQLQICVFLGLFYCIALALLKVPYFVVIGIFTGILSFIPYVGTFFAFVSTNIVIITYKYDIWWIVVINIVLLLGQILEAVVVSPKVLGKSVNMNPVWIMFAIFAGGSIAGFLGVCIAVPCAAFIKVVLKYQFDYYLRSDLYKNETAQINSK